MKVRDIMTANPLALIPSDSVSSAAEIMRDKRIGCLPVVDSLESKSLVGIITDRDIAVRCMAEGHSGDCLVEVHMTAGRLRTAHPGDHISKIIREMEFGQVRRIPVVMGDSRTLVGIVSQADVARLLGPTDPEVVDSGLARVSDRVLVPV